MALLAYRSRVVSPLGDSLPISAVTLSRYISRLPARRTRFLRDAPYTWYRHHISFSPGVPGPMSERLQKRKYCRFPGIDHPTLGALPKRTTVSYRRIWVQFCRSTRGAQDKEMRLRRRRRPSVGRPKRVGEHPGRSPPEPKSCSGSHRL